MNGVGGCGRFSALLGVGNGGSGSIGGIGVGVGGFEGGGGGEGGALLVAVSLRANYVVRAESGSEVGGRRLVGWGCCKLSHGGR